MKGLIGCNDLLGFLYKNLESDLVYTGCHQIQCFSSPTPGLQCQLVRKNKNIIRADWRGMESGSPEGNLNINKGIPLYFPSNILEI